MSMLQVTQTRYPDGRTVVLFPEGWDTREGVVSFGHKDSLRWDKYHPLLENEKVLADRILRRCGNAEGRRFGKAGFFGSCAKDEMAENSEF